MRCAFILSILLSGPLIAQSWQIFDMDNANLPSNTIKALVQDGNGIVWAGTDWGLCRYDGSQWTVLQQTDGGLPENGITALAVDAQDRLWVGTSISGIAILEDDVWMLMDMGNSDLPDNSINGITHDHRGWTWISTALGLACITNDGWRIYDNTSTSHMGMELFSPHVRMTAVRTDDLVCVATMNGGLTYITEDDMVYYTTFNSNFFDNSANAIALDANGDRWIASATAGLIRHAGPYDDINWFNYTTQNSGFPDNTLTSLVIDGQNTKYAGTEIGGVIVFPANGVWTTLDMNNSGLPDDRVLCLMLDADSVLWAGTFNGGIARRNIATGVSTYADLDPYPQVHPSLFQDFVQIDRGTDLSFCDWTILDAGGRVELTGMIKGERYQRLELGHLAPGIHFLMVQDHGSTAMVKLVKLH